MPVSETRAIERKLLDRYDSGDKAAKWELFARQEEMIGNSARKFANGDPLLEEEMIMASDQILEDAFRTYNRNQERYETFSSWVFQYLGWKFKPFVRERKNQQTGGRWIERGELPEDGIEYDAIISGQHVLSQLEDIPEPQYMNGRMNRNVPFYHSSEPVEIDNDLPVFLDEKTDQIATLLSQGFSPGEVKGMTGLSESEYRKKVDSIMSYYRDKKVATKYDQKTITQFGSHLLDSWLQDEE